MRAPLIMLDSLGAAAINHLLRSADWARARLKQFAGASVRFTLAPFSSAFTISDEGTFSRAALDVEPNAIVRLTPALALRLIVLRDQSARAEIIVEGDAALASALTRILSTLRWDVEEDLSHVVGDIAAHRIYRAGETLERWRRDVAANLARSIAEYVTEERAVVAGREALQAFANAVDELRDDVERLDKRIERLSRDAPTRVQS